MTNLERKFVFLSHFINTDTQCYGGKAEVSIRLNRAISRGDSSNSKFLSFPNHVGTHIDFPSHFSEKGKTINDYGADFWLFSSPFLFEYKAKESELIDLRTSLGIIPPSTDFLIIRTGFQRHRGEEKYWKYNPGLHPVTASLLRKQCPMLRAVGIDSISVSSFQNREMGRVAHRKFLNEEDILVIEDMNLEGVSSDIARILCLPLLIERADGAPVTVIAELNG